MPVTTGIQRNSIPGFRVAAGARQLARNEDFFIESEEATTILPKPTQTRYEVREYFMRFGNA